MKAILRFSVLIATVSLLFVSAVYAQGLTNAASSAAAKAVSTPSGGRPSTIQVRQNIIAQKAAALQRELKELQRCITNASQLQTLRDPEGNINIVPQNDLINCTRRLQDLQRRQDSLNRANSRPFSGCSTGRSRCSENRSASCAATCAASVSRKSNPLECNNPKMKYRNPSSSSDFPISFPRK